MTVIEVPSEIWEDASSPVKAGSSGSEDVKAAVVTALNGLMQILDGVSFISGTAKLAQALLDFGDKIELSLGCVAVDMTVVASGLHAAARALPVFDHELATTFAGLEHQMSLYTSTYGVPPLARYIPVHYSTPVAKTGGSSLGHLWHDITSWGSDAYHGTVGGLESVGVPAWISLGVGGLVLGLYYTGVFAGGAAAGAAL